MIKCKRIFVGQDYKEELRDIMLNYDHIVSIEKQGDRWGVVMDNGYCTIG